jgi:XTP/dITP diphosphohydrolase
VTPPLRLVVASANPDKVAEIAAILGPAIELLPRPPELPDVVEDAPTLEGNARLKAVAISVATRLAAVADDTGLEVDALGGAPGVRSGRYAGEHASYADNVSKLLGELDRAGALDPDRRRARFRTVAVVVVPAGSEVGVGRVEPEVGGRVLEVDGVVEGFITREPRGDGGFGYDSVFVPDEADGRPGDRTFAEMTAAEKHVISHRGRAFRALAAELDR